MNKLPDTTRVAILRCLTDGMSLRATCRVTGASMGAVLRLLAEVGDFCEVYQDHLFRNLSTTRVEADEQWSYVGAKARNASQAGHGDLWTYCAMDADSRLVFSWLVGPRDYRNTQRFVDDVARRMAGRVQLTTDGFGQYMAAVRQAFKFATVDYAQLVKKYGQSMETGPARRYSPPVCIGAEKVRKIGRPDPDLVSTSYVERLNLNTRQQCRRFTRLTNAFSKKAANHAYAVALQFFAHNFVRPHGTLSKAAGAKTTPAMASGLADRVWTWEDVVDMLSPDRLLQ